MILRFLLGLAALTGQAEPSADPSQTRAGPRGDVRLIADVRRAAERVEQIRGTAFRPSPSAVRAPGGARGVAAEIRVARTIASERLEARGRAWEDVGFGLRDLPSRIYRRLAGDVDGVAVDPTSMRLLVDPGRLTSRDFVPEEGGDDAASILLLTGVRPDEPVVAHALVHLLQRQRAADAWPDTSDALWARRAWAEGESNLVAVRYLFAGLELEDDVLEPPLDPGTVLGGDLLPPGLDDPSGPADAVVDWVYREGFARAAASFRRGGWAALETDMATRPTSRDVIHGDRAPLVPEAIPEPPSPAPGLALVDRDSLGELGVAVTISTWTGMGSLGPAVADGWSGDALFRFEGRDPERGVTRWITRWISPREAEDFEYGYLRGLDARFPARDRERLPDGGTRVVGGGRVMVIERKEREVEVRVTPAAGIVTEDEPAGVSGL